MLSSRPALALRRITVVKCTSSGAVAPPSTTCLALSEQGWGGFALSRQSHQLGWGRANAVIKLEGQSLARARWARPGGTASEPAAGHHAPTSTWPLPTPAAHCGAARRHAEAGKNVDSKKDDESYDLLTPTVRSPHSLRIAVSPPLRRRRRPALKRGARCLTAAAKAPPRCFFPRAGRTSGQGPRAQTKGARDHSSSDRCRGALRRHRGRHHPRARPFDGEDRPESDQQAAPEGQRRQERGARRARSARAEVRGAVPEEDVRRRRDRVAWPGAGFVCQQSASAGFVAESVRTGRQTREPAVLARHGAKRLLPLTLLDMV